MQKYKDQNRQQNLQEQNILERFRRPAEEVMIKTVLRGRKEHWEVWKDVMLVC